MVGLVAASAFLRWLGARGVAGPWYTPDEQTYALLARSLYETGRLDVLGADVPFYTLVYPALIGLPLTLFETEQAFELTKALQAIVMSLTAIPVFLWGRRLMAPGWAFAAAALTLAVPGLAFSGFLMTEVVFYPVLCLTAWAMANALARPTRGAQLLAVLMVAVALLTRIQAVVVVPAFVLAIALQLWFERSGLRTVGRFAPALAGLAAVVLAWVALQRGEVFGAYAVTGEISYDYAEAARFTLYHVGALLLATAVIPVVAWWLVAARAFARSEQSRDVAAFVAVSVALTAGIVAQVGLFTSRLLGRLAERNLLALLPLVFIGFALWLDRGAARPRIQTALAAFAALGVMTLLPLDRLVTPAAIPDAYSVFPLVQVREHYPTESLRLVVLTATACLLALLVLWPRPARGLLPAALAALLAGASIWVSGFLATSSRIFNLGMAGAEPAWIDEHADSDVAFLYAGEQAWSGGAPIWANVFWNRAIDHVYRIGDTFIAGPIPSREVAPQGDAFVDASAARVRPHYVVASRRFAFIGDRVAESPSSDLALWRVDPPLRLAR